MKRAQFIAPARREFLAEVAYCNGKEPGLSARFAAAVEEATIRAVAFPFAGSLTSKNTRRAFVKDFPFALVYRPDEDGIVGRRAGAGGGNERGVVPTAEQAVAADGDTVSRRRRKRAISLCIRGALHAATRRR